MGVSETDLVNWDKIEEKANAILVKFREDKLTPIESTLILATTMSGVCQAYGLKKDAALSALNVVFEEIDVNVVKKNGD